MRKRLYLLSVLILISHYSLFAQDSLAAKNNIWGKDNIHLNVSIPFGNMMSQLPPTGRFTDGGILGLTIGGDLCYTDYSFLSVQAGASLAAKYRGEFVAVDTISYHTPSSFFVNIRNNHVWRKHDFGYGLMLSMNRDRHTYKATTTYTDLSSYYSNIGLGGSFSIYARMAYFLYAGLLYQPQFYSLSDRAFKYEHMFSIDFLFRLNMKSKGSSVKE